MDGIYLFIVVAISIVYVFWGLLDISDTKKTLWQIIADGVLTFAIGYSIGQLLSLQGYKNGALNEGLVKAQKEHREKVASINAKLDKLEEYLDERHKKKVRLYQIQILTEEALLYDDFISGKYAKWRTDKQLRSQLSKSQIRAIYKAYHCRLKKISVTDLTKGSESHNNNDDELGETKLQHQKKQSIVALGSKIIWMLFFGFFSIQMAKDFNWTNLIWTGLQVVLFLGSGIMKYDSAYTYMKENVKDRYYAQIDILTSFEAWEEKQKKETINANNQGLSNSI